jgi:hypothetical protein
MSSGGSRASVVGVPTGHKAPARSSSVSVGHRGSRVGATTSRDPEDGQLIRDLLATATVLESRALLGVGLLRRAARRIAECECNRAERCPSCGGPIKQPALGRRRIYCTDRCRWAAAKRPRNGRVVA